MASRVLTEPACRGLRMSADEYLALGETRERYELIDGVVCMSPSASFAHQRIVTEIAAQVRAFLKNRPLGEVAVETDVRFADDLVYRPDLVYLSREKASRCKTHVTEPPDVVVEVVSPDSRRLDRETKKRDYERFGVGEYWLVDPLDKSFAFHRLLDGRWVDAAAEENEFASHVIAGFRLDLHALRAAMD